MQPIIHHTDTGCAFSPVWGKASAREISSGLNVGLIHGGKVLTDFRADA